jgi:predicted PurR-regulated permease PerM
MTPPIARRIPLRPVPTMLLSGIFLILLTAALKFGAGLLLPIAIAALFALLLDRPVRALSRRGVPDQLGAAIVVLGALAILTTAGFILAAPAARLVERAPRMVTQVQSRVRSILKPIQETARQVDNAATPAVRGGPQTVQIKTPGVLERLSVSTVSLLGTTVTVLFLTYALLAMLPAFRRKLAILIGTRSGVTNMEAVLTEIELQMSRYMLLNTLTSAGVGLAVWGFLAVVGLPSALLWGAVAAVLNFIPFVGALATLILVGVAALVAFDTTGKVLLAMSGPLLINILEGNLVTPYLMGRHLPLNPVAVFVSLLYWGWVWGPAGMLLAVPITVMLQIVLARFEALQPISVLLDN